MQLTAEQVQSLFQFTEKKHVHWYDLQLELVDHLACSIEEEMTKKHLLTFEEALDKVYKSFGLFGFATLVKEKENQLRIRARKMWWMEILHFFTWPKLSFVLLTGFVFWLLADKLNASYLMEKFQIAFLLAFLGFNIYVFKLNRIKRKLLLLQVGGFHYSFVVFIYITCVLFGSSNLSKIQFAVYATLGVLFTIVMVELFNKVKKQAKQLYPAAFS